MRPSAWHKLFLCVPRGTRGAVPYWCYTRILEVQLDKDAWSIFADPSPELCAQFGLTSAPWASARRGDALLGKIFVHLDATAEDGERGYCLCESPIHLGQLLDDIDAAEGNPG